MLKFNVSSKNDLVVLDYRNDQPRVLLPEEIIYMLMREKKKAGVLNTNFDFVEIITSTGEILTNRIIEDAQYLVLYHHENFASDDIKLVVLNQLSPAEVY